jgi:hypothetical protein
MRKKLKYISSFLFCLIILSELSISQIEDTICKDKIETFKIRNWTKVNQRFIAESDSLNFEKIRPCLLGKSKSEIIDIFGKPNKNLENKIVYYVERRPSTKKITRTVEFLFNDSEKLENCFKVTELPMIY